MQNLITKEGFNYKFNPDACAECQGQCCTGESGYIFLNNKEMLSISEFLGINVKDFAAKYLFSKESRFSIKEKKAQTAQGEISYECLFFEKEKNGCTIYPVRPNQCRTFPFWNHFKEDTVELRQELQQECQGVFYEKELK